MSSETEFTTIGPTDITVSTVCLGTWAIGGWLWGGCDDTDSVRTIHAALDKGINFIDTAPVYGFGHSEEIVGKVINDHGTREDIVVATKVGLEWDGSGNVVRNSSGKRIATEIRDSLDRLQSDYIDLYQVHWPDANIPFEETALAMKQLLDEGKIRAVGLSNFSPQQVGEFRKYCPVHAVQPPYNLFERQIDDNILPYALENNLSVLAYGAICRGLLSGRMSRERRFTGDDLRRNDPKFRSPRFEQYLAAVDELDRLAKEKYGKDVLSLAVRWVIQRGAIALWGARKPEQIAAVDSIFGWSISDDDMETIDGIIDRHVTDPVGPEFMAPRI